MSLLSASYLLMLSSVACAFVVPLLGLANPNAGLVAVMAGVLHFAVRMA